MIFLWKEKNGEKIYKSQSALSFFSSFPSAQFSDNLWYSLNQMVTADCFDDKLPAVHVGLITRWHISFCHLYKLYFRQAQ